MKSLFVSTLVLCAIAAPHVALEAAGQSQNARAQAPGISAHAAAQISALVAEKLARTAVQRKVDSQLLYGARIASGRAIAGGVTSLRVTLPMTPDNRAMIDVRATVTDGLLDRLRGLGAEVTGANARYRHVAVRAPLDLVEAIAAIAEVDSVAPDFGYMTSRGVTPMLRTIAAPPLPGTAGRSARNRSELGAALRDALRPRGARIGQLGGAMTNGGSVISEGVRTHRADEAQGTFGVTGIGVKIGVISDGVRTLGNSQARGDVGPVTIIGPAAPCTASSCDEGTAMLEIVADVAPGAQLYFASADGGPAVFAQHIRDLRAAGCDIIVDDVLYFVESAFQDGQTVPSNLNGGIIAQAVKDVAASGALYFSAAGNSGRLSAGTSGTWEGDFIDGGPTAAPLEAGELHNFGSAAAPQLFDTIVSAGGAYNTLAWAEPLGRATSDYDLYLLDSSGNSVLAAGTDSQNGSQDPFEKVAGGANGDRLVIVLVSGQGRFLHLDTNRGTLAVATAGEIHGHAATSAPNTFGVAATPACGGAGSTGPCSTSFTGANKVENFSSDGPRRIFFTSGGAAITPGNFSSTGGQLLQKPDLTAADGVSTSVPGFSPFFGTSAAAPHAAAIAALVKARNLAQSAAIVSSALLSTAIDINTPGWDRDSGFGIVMAFQAAEAAVAPPAAPTALRLRRLGPSSALASWSGVTGATSYTLKMGTTAHGPKTPVATVAGTSVVIAGLVRGQTYYFTVSAQNGAGASPDSVEIAFSIAGLDGTNDFDGDRRADLAIWRPGSGTWFWITSGSGYNPAIAAGKQWGVSTDKPFSGDIDGDGLADLIVWRPGTGTWYWLTSSSGYDYAAAGAKQWGVSTDVPLTADIDGDGRTDLIVWRPSTGTFFWLLSSSNFDYASQGARQWGNASLGDVPFLGDFDGDRKADLAVWRASTGTWFWLQSTFGFNYANQGSKAWGNQSLGDVPLLGDFDGDRRADLVVWRASTGTWFWLTSSSGYDYASQGQAVWGSQAQNDVPLLGDLDGDGRAELIVWRPGNGIWFWLTAASGYNYAAQAQKTWGTTSDIPMIR
jgi:hypothetical protein